MESPFYFRFILKIRFRHTKNESWFIGIFHYLLPCYQWRSLNHPSHQRPEIDFEILVHIFLVERHILLALSAYDAVDNLIQRFFCSLLVRIAHNESDIVVILLDCVDNGGELHFLLLWRGAQWWKASGRYQPIFSPWYRTQSSSTHPSRSHYIHWDIR